jgi:two-component system, chemotaxis family, chemotaxis protein CheY
MKMNQEDPKKFVRSMKIGIEKAVPGMVVSEAVKSPAGGAIIAADTILSETHISYLREMGVYNIYIELCDIPKECDPIRGKTVMVVDDSLFFRHMFAKMLFRMGMLVCGEFETAEEAIHKAVIYKPDLMVMDIHLPKMNGVMAINKMKPRLPDTKFLAVSGDKDRRVVAEALKAGASDYVVKPIKWDVLKPRILKLFESAAQH